MRLFGNQTWHPRMTVSHGSPPQPEWAQAAYCHHQHQAPQSLQRHQPAPEQERQRFGQQQQRVSVCRHLSHGWTQHSSVKSKQQLRRQAAPGASGLQQPFEKQLYLGKITAPKFGDLLQFFFFFNFILKTILIWKESDLALCLAELLLRTSKNMQNIDQA